MSPEQENQLETSIKSGQSLDEIVALLRRYKDQGISQADVYSFLEPRMRQTAPDEATDDRILEIADFVVGFCSPHMEIWEDEKERPGRQ